MDGQPAREQLLRYMPVGLALGAVTALGAAFWLSSPDTGDALGDYRSREMLSLAAMWVFAATACIAFVLIAKRVRDAATPAPALTPQALTARRLYSMMLQWMLLLQLARFGPTIYAWATGVAPSYPGQYEGRAVNTLQIVCILGMGALSTRQTLTGGRRYLTLALLIVGFVTGMVWQSRLP